MNLKKSFGIFLLINFMIWSVVPLLRLSMSMDTQEAIIWGKYCLWGTTKHPPLSGWLAYWFYKISGNTDLSMYVLSQICVVVGIIYIYKLARHFLNETQSILAAMLQFGIIYYQFSTPEYNVNVVSIALWPAATYHFWRAYSENKLSQWLWFAFFTALNLLNKYTGGLLIVAQALFILLSGKLKYTLCNYRFYLAVFIGLIITAPHLYWLYDNNFTSFNYIAGRSHNGTITSWWRHLFYPLKFLIAQILFSAAAWITYFAARIRWGKAKSQTSHDNTVFLLCIGFIPALIITGISLVQGSALKSMWGFPMLFPFGILLFYFFPLRLNEKRAKKLLFITATWSLIFAVAYVAQCCLTTSERFRTDGARITRELQQQWAKYTDLELQYVAAEVWYADMISLNSQYKIKPMIWFNPLNNPWFDAEDFDKKGALVIAGNIDEYHRYETMYPQKISTPHILSLEFKNMFGKTKSKDIYYGFYNVKEAKYGENKQ